MVATQPSKLRGGLLVLALNIGSLVLALGLQKVRMETLGVEAGNPVQAVAKSNLTVLGLFAMSGLGSFVLAGRDSGSSRAIALAILATLVLYIVFVLVAGQLWGS